VRMPTQTSLLVECPPSQLLLMVMLCPLFLSFVPQKLVSVMLVELWVVLMWGSLSSLASSSSSSPLSQVEREKQA